jgi:hypothetical protein
MEQIERLTLTNNAMGGITSMSTNNPNFSETSDLIDLGSGGNNKE